MHILFLTDNFPPEVNAPASRTFDHCREWVRAGHKVTVITCAPNFPKGQVYAGYRNRAWQRSTMDAIAVIRVWSYITANEGFVRRILDYMSFMVSAAIAAPFVRRVDIVVATSPQLFTACAGYLVSRTKRVPFIFELRDLWPESIKAVGAMKQGFVLRQLERLALFLYRRATRIICVTNAFKRELMAHGIDAAKIDVVTNGVDMDRFRAIPKDAELVSRFGLENKFVAGFVGTHGMAHALETILEAAAAVRNAPGGERFRFLLLGDGARKQALIAKADAMGLDNVIFVDSVSKEDVVRYWSLLDVSIIHLRKTDLFKSVIPSKLFECMGMGLPVLHGVEGESAQIVEQNGVGLTFEPENADELCAALNRIAEDNELQNRLRQACLEAAPRFERRALAGKMLTHLQQALARPPARAGAARRAKDGGIK